MTGRRAGSVNRGGAVAALAVLLLPSALRAQEPTIRPTGEVRVRYEARRPATTDSLDAFTLLRTRVGLEASFGASARAFIQVQDSRAWGEEGNTLSDATADQLDLHQGYIELLPKWGSTAVALRAGRQEIDLGNERLVGSVGWTNTGRSFDAARVILGTPDRWTASLLAATVAERGTTAGSPGLGTRATDDHTFLGAYLDAGAVEAFALYDVNAEFRTFRDVNRATLGGRADASLIGVSGTLEGALQLGSQEAGDTASAVGQELKAWFVGARLVRGVASGPLARVGLGLDWLSGDETPGDDAYGAFNTLYATNHKFYGFLDLFTDPAAQTGDRGLIDAIASLDARLGSAATLKLDLHRFWFAAPRGDEARAIGWELDATLPVRIVDGHGIVLGYSAFRNDAGAGLIGRGASGDYWHWGYVQAQIAF